MKNDNLIRELFDLGLYDVDEEGNVYGVTGKKLVPTVTSHGYVKHIIQYQGKSRCIAAHRMVYIKFKDGPEVDAHQIDHKDDNKTNNRLSNLELVTNSVNKLRSLASNTPRRLEMSEVMDVLERHFYYTETRRSIVQTTGFNSKTVDNIINGKTHRYLDAYRAEILREVA